MNNLLGTNIWCFTDFNIMADKLTGGLLTVQGIQPVGEQFQHFALIERKEENLCDYIVKIYSMFFSNIATRVCSHSEDRGLT